jgi:hypothetical protein
MNWTSVYKTRLRQLSTPSLYGEILKLENSIKHLRRSNDELRAHGEHREEEKSWSLAVIAENEEVIGKQGSQIELIRLEILNRGENREHAEDIMLTDDMAGTSNGVTVHATEETESNGEEMMDLDERSNGVHL